MSGITQQQAGQTPMQQMTYNGMGYYIVPPQPHTVYSNPATGQPVFFSAFPQPMDYTSLAGSPNPNFYFPLRTETQGNAVYPAQGPEFDLDSVLPKAEELFSVEETLSDMDSWSPLSPEVPSTPGSSVSSPRNHSQPSNVHKPVNILPSSHTPSSMAVHPLQPVQKQPAPSNSKDNLVLYLKNAKSKAESFANEFPSSLLCQPYKYDLKIAGPSYLMKQNLSLYLVYSDTLAKPYTVKSSVKIMKEDTTNNSEKIVRFQMTLCSFHFGKRQFRLAVEFAEPGADESQPVSLFFSTPFHTYARKKNYEHAPLSMSARPVKRLRQEDNPNVQPPAKRTRCEDRTSPSPPQASNPPIQPYLPSIRNNDRASTAIAIIDSLTPEERQAVHLYFGMHNGAAQSL